HRVDEIMRIAMEPARQHWKLISWPKGLGFSAACPSDGLAIGYAWPGTARAHLGEVALGRSGFAKVYNRAAKAGQGLASLLEAIARIAPERKVDILAHSLGARVALQAIRATGATNLGRVVLMGGAEYRDAAAEAIAAYAGAFDLYNVTSRANQLYDHLFQRFAPAKYGPALGQGLAAHAPRTVDLDLDAPATGSLLRARGRSLSSGAAYVCHWSFYLREGALPLYAAIFRERHLWHPLDLQAAQTAAPAAPRPGFGWPTSGGIARA
ncbi:MAG: alpha/beta hydrolase, partial [Pseudomonadota bacterium]